MESLKDVFAVDFQTAVETYLDRNRNILDTLSKYTVASARLERAIVKASTQCGCIAVSSTAPRSTSGITGTLCDNCREVIEQELGETLFFLTAAASSLGLSIYDAMLSEKQALSLLGNYSLK